MEKIDWSIDAMERRKLKKFGSFQGADSSFGDAVYLQMEQEQEEVRTKVVCRNCGGNHWTLKCPISTQEKKEKEVKETTKPGKYVPPGARPGAVQQKRDDPNTIRISNLAEDTTEDDVRELIRVFGTVSRVFVARDNDLQICKGFAFITFHERSRAQMAVDKLNGFGYGSLILQVDFAH
jgi:translation initiation factor 3 subunit G